jgi:hypothetical protein
MKRFTGILLTLTLGMTLGLSGQPTVDQDLTSREKELLKYFKNSLTMVPQQTKKWIDREAILKECMKPCERAFLHVGGEKFSHAVATTKMYPKKWPVSNHSAITNTIPGEVVMYEILSPEYGIIAPTELDLSASVYVNYEPGQLIVPNGKNLKPYTMKVFSYDLHNPTTVQHSGELKVNSIDRGQWTVKVPGGTFDCVMYSTTYDGKVGPASVEDTCIVFVNPEIGVVARVTRSKVSAFLVYNSDDRYAYVLAEKPTK